MFRAQSFRTDYPSLFRTGDIYLAMGQHRAEVMYSTTCYGYVIRPDQIWMAGVFRVLYQQLKQN